MTREKFIYIFVEKNLGHGFETIYPFLPQWKFFLLRCLIKGCRSGLSRRLGFLLYHRVEVDESCPDPRARGRSPMVDMIAVFPWNFDANHLFSEEGNHLLKRCWEIALAASQRGANAQMTVELPII